MPRQCRHQRREALGKAWLAHQARALFGWVVLLVGGLLAVGLGAGTSEASADRVEVRRGGELYQFWCATCHANDGSGVAGIAPPLNGFSVATVDLSLRTGRMPLADPRRGVREREFTDEEREAVVAYLTEFLDLEGELIKPGPGDASRGRDMYAVHCAQCHGATGKGGIAGDGVEVPAIQGLDAVTIASAVREGPFAMPRFGEDLISDSEIGDIVAFLDERVHEPTSPLGLAEVSKFEVIGVAALLTGVAVVVCAVVGGARRRREGPPREEG